MAKESKTTYLPETEKILVRGLNAMTKACDALTKQNETLNNDIEGLKTKIKRLSERVLIDKGNDSDVS
jgi:chaperonin cofactor prefoldin